MPGTVLRVLQGFSEVAEHAVSAQVAGSYYYYYLPTWGVLRRLWGPGVWRRS